jgi:hypothetical protein
LGNSYENGIVGIFFYYFFDISFIAYFCGSFSSSVIDPNVYKSSTPFQNFLDEKSFIDLLEKYGNHTGVLVRFVDPQSIKNMTYKISLTPEYGIKSSACVNVHSMNDISTEIMSRYVTFENGVCFFVMFFCDIFLVCIIVGNNWG